MINIKVSNSSYKELIDPVDMISSKYGKIFRQYFNGKPTRDYYISCGQGELSVIHIWFNTEDNRYEISTDDRNSLKGLVKSVKVLPIDARIDIQLIDVGKQ